MNAIKLEVQKERYVLSIEKSMINRDYLDSLIRLIRLEHLAQKVDFDEGIEILGEELKADWWQKNKAKLLGEKL